MIKKILSLSFLYLISPLANSANPYVFIPPESIIKPHKPKLGIAKTQTEFGAMAVPEQAKRMVIVKIQEECQFDQSLFKVDYKEPVRFIIKNENPYTINLMFTSLEKPQFFSTYYKTVPVPIIKKVYHSIKIEPDDKYIFNWFFNRKKYFKWICYNSDKTELAIAEIQVGNASKFSKKQKLEERQQNKFKNLPAPPSGF